MDRSLLRFLVVAVVCGTLGAGCDSCDSSRIPSAKGTQVAPGGSQPGAAAQETDGEEDQGPFSDLPLGLDPYQRKIPDDNPLTPEKVELGRHLYFDVRLSKDDTVSCASCHENTQGWSDGEKVATGVDGQKGGRSAPTIINRVFSTTQFWDGRATSLEEQALGPIQNPIEMGMTLDVVVRKLAKIQGYKSIFRAAFGDEEITPDRIAKAIASFERTIVSGNSRYDQYEAGDQDALTETERRGRDIFFDNKRGRCSVCHAGSNFTDEEYHNLGVGMDKPQGQRDLGRHDKTRLEKDKGAFKTPTLRCIAGTAPYMHDGSEPTLEAVVEFYIKGGIRKGNPNLDNEMKALNLTKQEQKDLIAFLRALSGEVTQVTPPQPVK